ncbi:hypothetical protein [Rhodopseudomonas palustris]|uniref:hypothetical protein n=1 Tax=Rhodopseudomonas palustris TaxID=1076 RepID=UPI001A9F3979|nr:hypothetical protein [Rhodopseudomonas palustris]
MNERQGWTLRKRSLVGASLTHALHDGYTDALYAFLPIWQTQFGLSYAGLAVVRALYYGTMGGLQIPADHALRAVSPRAALILSTILASAGDQYPATHERFDKWILSLKHRSF